MTRLYTAIRFLLKKILHLVIQLAVQQTQMTGEVFRVQATARGMPQHATLQRTATVFLQRQSGNGLRAAAKATPMPEATI